jgi:hypothetical protein
MRVGQTTQPTIHPWMLECVLFGLKALLRLISIRTERMRRTSRVVAAGNVFRGTAAMDANGDAMGSR